MPNCQIGPIESIELKAARGLLASKPFERWEMLPQEPLIIRFVAREAWMQTSSTVSGVGIADGLAFEVRPSILEEPDPRRRNRRSRFGQQRGGGQCVTI
jgi:hypothetical protein